MGLSFTQNTTASECIVVNEVVYCQQEQKVKLGGVELEVTDIRELFRKSKSVKGGLKKTGLYDDYYFIPVVEELARQNGMGYHEFIKFMVKEWKEGDNPFELLWNLEIVYDDLPNEYKPLLVDIIKTQIEEVVVNAIYDAYGISSTNRVF